ncbi:MAG: PleD family two-component system response regulator [Pyrinomonadaceae bacterium]
MTEEQKTEMNVLVADDDPAILRLVTAIVEKEGYRAVVARDGKEAYKILQSGTNFRAAVFDVVMPYIQGTELVKFMQTESQLKGVPVIMMTAEQSPKLSSDSLSAGAVAFLPKPFTASQLKMMLQMLTNTKKKEK